LKEVWAPVWKVENTAVGIRHADHVTPVSKNCHFNSPTSDGRLVGIVRWRTKATEFFFYYDNREYAYLDTLSFVSSPSLSVKFYLSIIIIIIIIIISIIILMSCMFSYEVLVV
jgi:hypothetical protein